MFNVSKSLVEKYWSWSPQKTKLTISTLSNNTVIVTEQDICSGGLSIDRYSTTSSRLEIGCCTSAQLTLRLRNRNGIYDLVMFEGAEIDVQISLDGNTWIKCGKFIVDGVPKKKSIIDITALDRMVFFDKAINQSDITLPITVQNLIVLACNKCNVPINIDFTNKINKSISISAIDNLKDISWRGILQRCLILLGEVGYIDCEGKFTCGWYNKVDLTLTEKNRYSSNVEEKDVTITGVVCTVSHEETKTGEEGEEEKEIVETKYTSGNDLYAIDVSNPFINTSNAQSIIDAIGSKVNEFSYLPFDATIKPSPFIWPLDIITLVDHKGVSHDVPITNCTYVLNGKTSISGVGETEQANSYFRGNEATGEIASAIKGEIKKYENILAYSISANILKAIKGSFEELDTKYAKIDLANITNLTVKEIFGETADFTTIVAQLGKINQLVTEGAVITDASVIHLTNSNASIDNAVIKSSMIESLNAEKINSGTINTNNVSIVANDNSGKLQINGTTMQFVQKLSDGTEIVRIQIGKDASGNYNVIIRNDSGQVILNENGVTENAIADNLIVNDMISTETKIDGNKLNISDIVQSINNDGDKQLNAGSLLFNGQMFEVALNEITEGINTKISTLSSKVNSISSTVTEVSNDINDINTKYTSSINQTKDAIELKLSETKTKIDNIESSIKDNFENINSAISIKNGEVTFGSSETSTSLHIKPDKISFSSHGDDVAYISDNTMNITYVDVKNSIKIDKFGFFPRSDGSLDFKKVG